MGIEVDVVGVFRHQGSNIWRQQLSSGAVVSSLLHEHLHIPYDPLHGQNFHSDGQPRVFSYTGTKKMSSSPLLSLPPELRDNIYSFLFLPATATTEHPFLECFPPPSRFKPYQAISLVNKALHHEAKDYFTTFIAPRTTIYLTTVASLRYYQSLALSNPVLQRCTFHLRANSFFNPPRDSVQTRAQAEEVMALMRLQPGFEECMDQVSGFQSIPVRPQRPYQDVLKGKRPRKPKQFHLEQTGGEVCDSPRCRQKVRGYGNEVKVEEVRYLEAGLSLCCYIWRDPGPFPSGNFARQLLCLEGKLSDLWVPDDVVKVFLMKRRHEL